MSGRANKEWRPCPTRKVSAALTQISLSLESTRLCVSRATQGYFYHAAYPNCGTLEFTELLVALQRSIFLLSRPPTDSQLYYKTRTVFVHFFCHECCWFGSL